MADSYRHTDPSTGAPACPDDDLGPFGAGEFKNLNDRGGMPFEGSDNADAALAAMGGLRGTKRISSTLSSGPVTIPSEGGPRS